jgi:hypothetical protein
MEKCSNMSSDEESNESDFAEDDTHSNKNDNKMVAQKLAAPVSYFRFVTKLNGRHSLSKMSNDQEIRSKVMAICSNQSETLNIPNIVNDSDDENGEHDDDNDVLVNQSEEKQHVDTDLNDLRQKALEYDQQQLKGIQLANAGAGNLRVVNNYPITSSTCTLM